MTDIIDQIPSWLSPALQWAGAVMFVLASLRHVRRGRFLLTRTLVAFVVFGTLSAWIVGSSPRAVKAVLGGGVGTSVFRSPFEAAAFTVLLGAPVSLAVAFGVWSWARIRDDLPPESAVASAVAVSLYVWATRGSGGLAGVVAWTTAVSVGAYVAWFLLEGIDRIRVGDRIGPPRRVRVLWARCLARLGRPEEGSRPAAPRSPPDL